MCRAEVCPFGNKKGCKVTSTCLQKDVIEQYKEALQEGYSFLAGLAELRDVTYVELPTSHWPMWSRPQDLATIIGDVAQGASAT